MPNMNQRKKHDDLCVLKSVLVKQVRSLCMLMLMLISRDKGTEAAGRKDNLMGFLKSHRLEELHV